MPSCPPRLDAEPAAMDGLLEPQLARLRRDFIEDLWRGMVVVALVGVPISVSRSAISGWLPVYTSHVLLAVLVLTVFLLRRRMSYGWLSGLFLALLWAVGLPGVLSFGLISASTFWLVLSCYVASNLYSVRVGLVFTALTGLAILAVGAGFVSGRLTTLVPEALYHRQISAWLTLLVATGAFIFLCLRAIGMHQRALVDLMAQIQARGREVSDLYDHAPCGYHSLDADGRLVRINQTELRWLGLAAASQALGRPFDDFLAPASRAAFRQRFAQSLQTGALDDAEFELLHADGSTRPVLLSATALRDAQGRFVRSRTMVVDLTERKKLEQRLDQLARTDALTGLSNRHDFNERAMAEIARSRRNAQPLALLMLDIDHFKQVNDRFGHDAGDLALRHLAAACRQALRGIDLPARLGGEEFVALLPETALPAARDVAERLRQHIEALDVTLPQRPPLRLTVSIGVAELATGDRGHEDLMRRADEALYAAKRAGRNRVVAAG